MKLLTERPTLAVPPAPLSVSYAPEVESLLTGPVPALLDGFLNVLAQMPQGSLVQTEVGVFCDPEEDTRQIVVRQWVPLARPALSNYLAEIGQAVETWLESLSPVTRLSL